jgi:hypothetical protein
MREFRLTEKLQRTSMIEAAMLAFDANRLIRGM